MRALDSTKNSAVIATLALLGLTSAAVVARGFENGGFDEGLAGWQVESARKAIGLATADAQLGTEPFRDSDALARLQVGVTAGTFDPIEGPGGASVALARLRQDISDIPSTALTFDWTAGYWGTLSGRGMLTYQARLIVERTTPSLRHEYDLLERRSLGGYDSCGAAMVFDARPIERSFYTDLSQVGFKPGDDIRVTVEIRAQARALRSCDFAAYGCVLWVDQFALRSPLVLRQGWMLSASKP